jgi:anti-sigma regulatory factor (Ser/Thr protein kinase)
LHCACRPGSCARAAALREQAKIRQRLAQERANELAENLVAWSGRPLGDRNERFLLRLARLEPMVRFARRDFRRWLEGQDVEPEVVADVTLACSEACANAVEHPAHPARPVFEVEACREDDELELCVRDFGRWNEHARSELRGRGLSMICRLMDSVEVDPRAGGIEIVMRRSLVGRQHRPVA